jgi:hypothetical protein
MQNLKDSPVISVIKINFASDDEETKKEETIKEKNRRN